MCADITTASSVVNLPRGARPCIEFDEIKLPEVLDKTQEALAASDAPLFQRSGCLVHVYRLDQDSGKNDIVRRKAGALLIRNIQKPRLREYLM